MSRSRRGPGPWIDEGPGSGRSRIGGLGDPIRSFSALEIPGQGGAGAIERRQATEAQRATGLRPRTTPLVLGILPLASQRSDGLGRSEHAEERQDPELPSPALTPAPEETVMPEPVPPQAEPEAEDLEDVDLTEVALAALQDATTEARAAYDEHARAEARWFGACEALVAAYRATGLAEAFEDDDPVPPDSLPAQSIELADGTLMRVHSDGKPETIAVLRELGEVATAKLATERPPTDAERMAASRRRGSEVNAERIRTNGGGPGSIPPFKRRLLDALVANDGDYTRTARALGLKRASVVGSMSGLRKLEGLTEAEQAVVAAGKRGSS